MTIFLILDIKNMEAKSRHLSIILQITFILLKVYQFIFHINMCKSFINKLLVFIFLFQSCNREVEKNTKKEDTKEIDVKLSYAFDSTQPQKFRVDIEIINHTKQYIVLFNIQPLGENLRYFIKEKKQLKEIKISDEDILMYRHLKNKQIRSLEGSVFKVGSDTINYPDLKDIIKNTVDTILYSNYPQTRIDKRFYETQKNRILALRATSSIYLKPGESYKKPYFIDYAYCNEQMYYKNIFVCFDYYYSEKTYKSTLLSPETPQKVGIYSLYKCHIFSDTICVTPNWSKIKKISIPDYMNDYPFWY
jgi:hypothetical protein